MAKKLLLFIDTNVFLDFYRAKGDAGLTLLKHVESVTDVLIMTDQVEVEFLNHRQRVISSALTGVKAPDIPDFMPAYLADSNTAAALDKDIKRVKKRIQVIKDRFARILKDPGRNDPVFKSFRRIVDNSLRNFNFADREKQQQIFGLAARRHQRGFPPRKPDANSIGDAINWEWIVDTAILMSSDVLIVSRDGDYGLLRQNACNLNDWLLQEFKQRVSSKRNVVLAPSLSAALKMLNVKVTAAEEKEERNIIDQMFLRIVSVPPNFWQTVIERVKAVIPRIHQLLLGTDCLLLDNGDLMISFPPNLKEHIREANSIATRTLLLSILTEL